MPRTNPIKDPGKIIDSRRNGTDSKLKRPTKGPDNRPITQKPLEGRNHKAIAPGSQHITVINNTTVINNIRITQNNWNTRDHDYHWHEWNGYRMCHHYDELGFHWWGFYVGDVYFWTRYWNDYYWWYDPYWHRWCYMRDGFWWWQDPARVEVVYIYRDGGYYQYENSPGGVVVHPDPTLPVDPDPDPVPAPAPDQKTFYSLDGYRMVQVVGDNQDAFLYDTADPPAFEPRFLISGVTDVRFKLDDGRQLAQILALTKDDSYTAFDKDGNPVNVASSSPIAESMQKSTLFNALETDNIRW